MTSSESALADFDFTLQPIGFALAQEFLATPDERAQSVVVRLSMSPADPASPIDWFAPAEPVAEIDEPEAEILRAS
ncbi:hypothetical protein [Pseudonocardia sp. GCM10023141]|uniref:hypothetical protein n=1 Tax=Pseudonocardia sp. GCM10023141 TaxID=3252653 RepID=UPI00361A7D1E